VDSNLVRYGVFGIQHNYFNNQQVQFDLVVTVIERAGLPCQLEDPYYPGYANIPCKFGPDGNLSPDVVANSGYPLQPGKVIKLDVKTAHSQLGEWRSLRLDVYNRRQNIANKRN